MKVGKDESPSLMKILFSELPKWFERETEVTFIFWRAENRSGWTEIPRQQKFQDAMETYLNMLATTFSEEGIGKLDYLYKKYLGLQKITVKTSKSNCD
ncbi:hypothetical protein AVEN_31400-1 [Araneus ventricosus]|uniref:Uncharacterized protein n=1 Tax=Araneus ventricosus TaxID=182803 RepID=A0A4Y2F588_ARAVE|nr:hypothetical protein AVEN_31400-1 [Araneus ventricosus]